MRVSSSQLRGLAGRKSRPRSPATVGMFKVVQDKPGHLIVELPIRTVSELNRSGSENYWIRHNRAKQQRGQMVTWLHRFKLPALPAAITFTRLSARTLDSDNLVSFAKHLRDQLADMYGVNDRSEAFRCECKQETRKAQGVRLEIRGECAKESL